MYVPDMPNVPPQDVPVMIAQANQAQSNNVTKTPVFGVCQPAPSLEFTGDNTLSPIVAAQSYFYAYEQKTVTGPATVTILQQPKHGVLRLVTEADRGTLFASSSTFDPTAAEYAYLPEQGYGKDSATLLVDFGGGLKVKVVFFFQQNEGPLGNTGLEDLCSKTGVYWKISSTLAPNGNSTLTSVDYLPSLATAATPVTNTITLDSILGTSLASTLAANTSGVTLNIANLPNATGYGWFVDTTPIPFY
ncbi:hypothetical protein GALL_412110 [mine drainage metagenome]|uniref:Uncharacterized protein n=1 Tax=mine drainage metagenome TaxID=410659 RepID=A0A1J5QHV9_9ZZZZ